MAAPGGGAPIRPPPGRTGGCRAGTAPAAIRPPRVPPSARCALGKMACRRDRISEQRCNENEHWRGGLMTEAGKAAREAARARSERFRERRRHTRLLVPVEVSCDTRRALERMGLI